MKTPYEQLNADLTALMEAARDRVIHDGREVGKITFNAQTPDKYAPSGHWRFAAYPRDGKYTGQHLGFTFEKAMETVRSLPRKWSDEDIDRTLGIVRPPKSEAA